MDDVDGAQAQIARNMVESGDWVTPHINGVIYVEKPPFIYWSMAASYLIFGFHDWAARVPVSLMGILLCWMVARMAGWAMGPRTGMYAGLCLAVSVGLWLFTRILIADVGLTLAIGFTLWNFLRALHKDSGAKERKWSALGVWAGLGLGILLKGLIALVFPVGAAFFYLLVTGQLWRGETWRRLRVGPGMLVMLAIATPWHVLATLRNPPYFVFALDSGPHMYRGFFWNYFINEHLLRFLNRRYPHDYNTVPRYLFWLLHLAWFFPFSVFFARTPWLRFRGNDRAARMRLLCLCLIGVVMVFFTFSTTQEYYSMPAYPAFAILIGSAMAEASERAFRISIRVVATVALAAVLAIIGLLWGSWGYATPGDIAQALAHHPEAYTLSLGHMGDLTLRSFAYLRVPLAVAGVATLIGALGGWLLKGQRAALALALMMVVFFQAARLALIAFDPYLGSYPLAEALNKAPQGGLIFDDPYYEMSSIVYYTGGRRVLMLNGRVNNLEYGSWAPGAPDVFIDNAGFVERWRSSERWYISSEDEHVDRLRALVGDAALHPVASAGGKTIYVNQP